MNREEAPHLRLVGCERDGDQAERSGGANRAEDLLPNPGEIHAASLDEEQRQEQQRAWGAKVLRRSPVAAVEERREPRWISTHLTLSLLLPSPWIREPRELDEETVRVLFLEIGGGDAWRERKSGKRELDVEW